ncbi:MAG: NAD(P)/FAD-dependent oxidoreductase [Pseudobdellovibrionaceae bacterium]
MKKKVIIVGGGFGGINAAKKLAGCSDLEILLIDKRNHHLFQPLLYQVAMAGLSPAEIAVPIRSIFSNKKNVQVILGEVTAVNLAAKKIVTDFAEIDYDFLILACGAQHSYFGHKEWEDFAPGMKTLEQATEIRRRVLNAFELAERATNPEEQKKALTFVIVGGGPTGVELAGALGEITRFTIAKDFRKIDPSRTRVVLIEAGSRILASFDPSLSQKAARDLENLGVSIWTGARVTKMNSEGVFLGSEFVKAGTIIWAAGVKPSSLNVKLGVELDSVGRVVVEKDLSIRSYPEVFVIGDAANFQTSPGQALPGLAPVAIQEGIHAAKTILADLGSEKREDFHYLDKGQMATIGRKKAVLQFKSLKMSGFIAWLGWLFVHIYYLIGFKNRFFVFAEWAFSYFTYHRGARLITQKNWHSEE